MTTEYSLHFKNLYLEDYQCYDDAKDLPIHCTGYITYIINEMPSGNYAEFIRCKIQDTEYGSNNEYEPLQGFTTENIDNWQNQIVDGFNSNESLCIRLAKYKVESLDKLPAE